MSFFSLIFIINQSAICFDFFPFSFTAFSLVYPVWHNLVFLLILILLQMVRSMQNILSPLMALMCGTLSPVEKPRLEQKSCLILTVHLPGEVAVESIALEWLFGREA